MATQENNNSLVKKIIKIILQKGKITDNNESICLDDLTLICELRLPKKDMARNLLVSNSQIFRFTNNSNVELNIKVQLCPQYCSTADCGDGCCPMFHICKLFALSDQCSSKRNSCNFAHELWDEGHNQNLLERLMLDELDVGELRVLFGLSPNQTHSNNTPNGYPHTMDNLQKAFLPQPSSLGPPVPKPRGVGRGPVHQPKIHPSSQSQSPQDDGHAVINMGTSISGLRKQLLDDSPEQSHPRPPNGQSHPENTRPVSPTPKPKPKPNPTSGSHNHQSDAFVDLFTSEENKDKFQVGRSRERSSTRDMANNLRLIKDIIKTIIIQGTMAVDGDAIELNIDVLSHILRLHQDLLQEVFARCWRLFRVKYGVVQLISEVKICHKFCSPKGCEDGRCPMFHICKFYALSDQCPKQSDCKFGHELWDKGHNQGLLEQLRLDELDVDKLRVLFQLPPNRSSATVPMVCTFYNNPDGCKKSKHCSRLHLCELYVKGCCFSWDCEKSHDVQSMNKLLMMYGIRVNRPPREILDNLKGLYDNIGVGGMGMRRSGSMQSLAGPGQYSNMARPGGNPWPMDRRNEQSSMHNSRRPSEGTRRGPSTPHTRSQSSSRIPKAGKQKNDHSNQKQNSTSSDSTICLFNLRGKCLYGQKCFKSHKKTVYQWQYKNDGPWIDFPEEQNVEIEQKYCDVADEYYHESKDRNSQVVIYKIDLTDLNKSDIEVRRLSTANFTNKTSLFDNPWTTRWNWFWKSDDCWVKYEQTGSLQYTAGIQSPEIEEKYSDSSDVSLEFTSKTTSGSNAHSYVLDFHSMTQTNTNERYKTVRKVARRPEYVNQKVIDDRNQRVKALKLAEKFDIPNTWDFSSAVDIFSHFQIVKVQPSTDEYKDINDLFMKDLAPNPNGYRVMNIERVENAELWRAFNESKSVLKRKLTRDVEPSRLYHGAPGDIVQAIAKQGFDCRLAGTKVGHLYGKGVYFGKTSQISTCYCDTKLKMLIAKVLVGDVTRGSNDFARPPAKDTRDLTSDLYDTCVDDPDDPKIFVKFDNNQVYPEYLITFTT